jgi:hypothetical protein
MTDSRYWVYLNAVRNWAHCFHRELFPWGAPYDPFLLADHLRVSIHEADLKGLDGYVENRGSDYHIFLSSRAPAARRRFTLSHELAHVLFMRTARKGGIKDSYLIRYRSNGLPLSELQDEREERLCNAFAQEFLLPTEAFIERGVSSDLSARDLVRTARDFQVSIQAVAVKLISLFRPIRIVSCLWTLNTPWPVTSWWTGGDLWFRKKWLLKSDIATLEKLALISRDERREISEIWTARGKRKFDLRIRIAPTASNKCAVALLSPFRPPRCISPPIKRPEPPLQLDLFGNASQK